MVQHWQEIDLYKFFQGLGAVGVFAFIALWIAGIIGWVMNIIDIIHSSGGPFTVLLVLRIVGIFAFPLGAILGWVS